MESDVVTNVLPDPKQQELALAPDAHAWERLIREKARAYAAFRCYRDLGPTRSLRAAYARFRDVAAAEADNVPGTWRAWKDRFRWDERAAAYDKHREDEQRAVEEAAEYDLLKEKLAERRKQTRKLFNVLDLMTNQAALMLKTPLGRLKKITDDPHTGRKIDEIDTVRALRELVRGVETVHALAFEGAKSPIDAATTAGEVGVRGAEFRWEPDPDFPADTE